jgi:hypothetical protein
MKSVEAGRTHHSEHPLAADGGITTSPSTTGDPYATLDDLMVVVEALCPRWPSRDTFKPDGVWVL